MFTILNIFFLKLHNIFLVENRYESLLPKIAHGSPSFDTGVYTISSLWEEDGLCEFMCMLVSSINYTVNCIHHCIIGLNNIYSGKMHDILKYNVKIIGSDSKSVAYLVHLLDML